MGSKVAWSGGQVQVTGRRSFFVLRQLFIQKSTGPPKKPALMIPSKTIDADQCPPGKRRIV